MVRNVIKRNGDIVPFDNQKIKQAIEQAITAVGAPASPQTSSRAKQLAEIVSYKALCTEGDIGVEQIQDLAEETLMQSGHYDAAKAFILYRSERAKIRNSSLMDTYKELTYSSADDSDIKRENANINGDTAMGTMLKYGSEGAKAFYREYILDATHAKAHDNGDIHIHDLDFYSLTTTCSQIDLIKLFKDGFSTGHGFLREPNDIASYSALACIAIQSNQNDQHGGQSIPNFDYALADGVRKTYIKKHYDAIKKGLAMSQLNLSDEKIDEIIDEIKETTHPLTPLLDWTTEETREYARKELDVLVKHYYSAKHLQEVTRKEAEKDTERATYQAMEALVHNLNTMNSRAGSQVPFSSINYGTDTSIEGRMVIRNILLATEAGLGNSETPIFPIQIFKVKEGINYNEGDPNYDLFKLSCRVSAKRLFPNYSFIDAPFNLPYYKEGDYRTEVGYMGCVQGDEVITYKIGDDLYVEGFRRAYERVRALYGENGYGISKYVDTENKQVSIYDSSSDGFVQCKKFIKNPNKNNWQKVKLTNGRNLLATADHPLPVLGKGRTFVSDLKVGDKVPVSYFQASEQKVFYSEDLAWLLGIILCDGCYANNVVISLGADEKDVVSKVESVAFGQLGIQTTVKKQERNKKGTYYDVNLKCGGRLQFFRKWLADNFEGIKKINRHIPCEVFSWDYNSRCAFLAGMVDADGYIPKRFARISLGSTNKELALQQLLLIQSLGLKGKVYLNLYSKTKTKYRYLIESEVNNDVLKHITSEKKASAIKKHGNKKFSLVTRSYSEVVEVLPSNCKEESYDVETASDRFDVSGISSHNCRTRVMGNVHDPNQEITTGRGNLSFTSINLPRIALLAEHDMDKFYTMLDERVDLVVEQLLHRLKIQSNKRSINFPFLIGQGVWLDSDDLQKDETIGEILKHGSLSIGFIGLAETLVALIGKHHGESIEARELGMEIVSHMRSRLDELADRTKLNFTLLATPAEGLSGRFVRMDKEEFGEVAGVTDREYYTNSFHVPVYYPISAFEKINIEAPYHNLTNAGHISYVELDGDPSDNLDAFEAVVRHMKETGIGYGSINHPVDRDPVCGYTGIIGNECPQCGRKEDNGVPFVRIRRITGYLVGSVERFNDAKRAEEHDRVKHG